jgi:hypothetical protein
MCKTLLLTRNYQVAGDPLSAWTNSTFDEEAPSLVLLLQSIRTILESFYSQKMMSDQTDVEDFFKKR